MAGAVLSRVELALGIAEPPGYTGLAPAAGAGQTGRAGQGNGPIEGAAAGGTAEGRTAGQDVCIGLW